MNPKKSLKRKTSCPVCVNSDLFSQSDCRMEAANAHTNCKMSKHRLEVLEFNPLKATHAASVTWHLQNKIINNLKNKDRKTQENSLNNILMHACCLRELAVS